MAAIMKRIESVSGRTERVQLKFLRKRATVSRLFLENLRADHARNFGWAMACCAWQQELAEDVLQEAYLRVLDGRAVFSARASQRTWFFAVIKHVASDIQRTQQRRNILNLQVVADAASDVTQAAQFSHSHELAEREEASAALRQALLQLSQRQREVVHLVFYGELTLEETAHALDISVGSARTHYHRAKQQLAQLLNLDADHE